MAVHDAGKPATPQAGAPGSDDGLDAYTTLKREIAAGVLPLQAKMPSAREIEKRFSIAFATAINVLNSLEADGLIKKKDRARAVVIATPDDTDAVTMADVIEELRHLRGEVRELRAEVADSRGTRHEEP
jgi:DNA-binding GntR family transcriptional regulator